jgi:hypothetical protein
LWAFKEENTTGLKIWNTSTWQASDLVDPSFDPAPLGSFVDSGLLVLADNQFFNFLPPIGGVNYVFSFDYVGFYIHRFNPLNGSAQLITQLDTPYSNSYVITSDFKYLLIDSYDFICANGSCANPVVQIYALAANYTNLTYVGNFGTKCPGDYSFIVGIGITPDHLSLEILCFLAGIEIFDFSTPTAPVSVQYVLTTGSLGNSPVAPFLACSRPGALTGGNGFSDGRTFQGYVNAVNETYSEVNALLTVSPSFQIAAFPSDAVILSCAITEKAHVISIFADKLNFYTTSDPTSPFNVDRVKCPFLFYAGSFLGYEHFYHVSDPACNCDALGISPCPPGMTLVSNISTASYMEKFSTGYFLSGREYVENGELQVPTTNWLDATWPVEFVNTNGTMLDTLMICDSATQTAIIPPNETRYQGKWVIIAPYFWSNSLCSGASYGYVLRDAGAYGVMRALGPGTPLYYLQTQPLSIPFFTISYEMFMTIINATVAPYPVVVYSPSFKAGASIRANVAVTLLAALFVRFLF